MRLDQSYVPFWALYHRKFLTLLFNVEGGPILDQPPYSPLLLRLRRVLHHSPGLADVVIYIYGVIIGSVFTWVYQGILLPYQLFLTFFPNVNIKWV